MWLLWMLYRMFVIELPNRIHQYINTFVTQYTVTILLVTAL